jgi:hypothetical protein
VFRLAQTLKERILQELKTESQTDRELTDKLFGYGKPQQSVNIACRKLRDQGFILRTERPIHNCLTELVFTQEHQVTKMVTLNRNILEASLPADTSSLSEESLKHHLNNWLITNGWETKVAWGKQHGIDIDAKRSNERWIIEVKGMGSRNAVRVNYFLNILGELQQRMDDPKARYSIALPDLKQFRNLWARLPCLAKQRSTINAIFVSETGDLSFTE